jgi:hypothetical protein
MTPGTGLGLIGMGLAIGILGTVMRVALVSRLKRMHTPTWREMGEPATLSLGTDAIGIWRTVGFAFSREERRKLDDPTIESYCRALRLAVIAWLGIILIILLAAAQVV